MKSDILATGTLGIKVANDDSEEKPKMVDLEISDNTEKILVSGDIARENGSSSTWVSEDTLELVSTEPRRPCFKHPRVTELYRNADWWTLWIGLASFGLSVALVFAIPLKDEERVKYVVPQPKLWQHNPLDAWDLYNLVGIPILLAIFCVFYLVSLKAMGKLDKKEGDEDTVQNDSLLKYVGGFAVMSLLATLSFWLGRNEWCSTHGLGYAVFAIGLGMLTTNMPLLGKRTKWLQKSAKDGEFFIKCSLVLLAVELDVLVRVGGPGMLVAWIGSPIAIAAGFVIGTRYLNCEGSLSMLIAVGASWCGASAISAVAPVVKASSEEVALAISVVAFFTVIFTFVQPYIAIATGMPDVVAGAWIG
jgi:hypothetical protein